MSETLSATTLFVLESVFDIYLFILIIRVILAWNKADYFNPITLFVVQVTNTLVKPVKKILPNMGGIETATVVLIVLIECLKFFFIALLSYGVPHVAGLIILAISDACKLALLTFFYAILLQSIISFVQPYSSLHRLLAQFTSPILWPIQRIIPPIAGIDISPIPALILIQATMMLLFNPLTKVGMGIAFG